MWLLELDRYKSGSALVETRKLETPPKEALFASAGGVEVSRVSRRWSWIVIKAEEARLHP
jgi:hypothetical protein